MKRRTKKILSYLAMLVGILLVAEIWLISNSVLSAATINVNNPTSQFGVDGLCSLPEAIVNANENSQMFTGAGECPAGTLGTDTIVLSSNISVTSILDVEDGYNGLPTIKSNILITGNNFMLSRPTQLNTRLRFRFFNIDPGASLELSQITLSNGYADSSIANGTYGGAILNAGTLILSDATLQINQAGSGGALYNLGTVSISNSTIRDNIGTNSGGIYTAPATTLTVNGVTFLNNTTTNGNGGGLTNEGTATTLKNVAFTNNGGNTTLSGGAIYNHGTLYGVNLTIRGNTASEGGGIFNNYANLYIVNSNLSGNFAHHGGAIYTNYYSTYTITNSILSGNHATIRGGAIHANSVGTLFTTTIAGNFAPEGGGIFNYLSLTLRNSLIWGNYASTAGSQIKNEGWLDLDYIGIEGVVADFGGTINTNNGVVSLASTETVFGNAIRATGTNTPNTFGNYFLNKYSNAINRGSNALLPVDTMDVDNDGNTAETLPRDKNGDARILEGTVDLGADESSRCNGISFPYTAGTADALRIGIVCANVTSALDIINLSANIILTDAFDSDNGLPPVANPLRINGNGFAIRRSSADLFRILEVATGTELTLNQIRISSGYSAGSGGAIYAHGNATIRLIRSIMSGNQAAGYGGVIRQPVGTGSIEVLNSMFIGNNASFDGMVIDTSNHIRIINSTIAGNNGVNIIWTSGSNDLILSNTLIYGNTHSGAVILKTPTNFVITNSALENLDTLTYTDGGGNILLPDGLTVFVAPQPPANAPTIAGNYRLAKFSPAINTGNNTIVSTYSLGLDFEGDPRIQLGTVDIGADESFYLPPEDTNLIYNPGFSLGADGKDGWSGDGSLISIVTGGVMNLRFPATVDGWLRQLITTYPLPIGAKMVGWVTVSNPDAVARNFQLMFRDNDLSNTFLCNFTIPASAQNRTYSIRFTTQTNWEIIRVDMRTNFIGGNGLDFDNVNLRYRPYLTFTENLVCISPGSDQAPTLPPATELVLTHESVNGFVTVKPLPDETNIVNIHPPEIGGNDGGCSALDWFNTDNWKGYLPTSEVQFVFDPFPTDLTVGKGLARSAETVEASLNPTDGDIFDANGDGSADTLYDALSYGLVGNGLARSANGGQTEEASHLPTGQLDISAMLIREAVIAMLNDRFDNNHPESWWAVEIDTAEALAQGENAMLALAQKYALSSASCQ